MFRVLVESMNFFKRAKNKPYLHIIQKKLSETQSPYVSL